MQLHLSTLDTTESLSFRPLNFLEPSPSLSLDTTAAVNLTCAGASDVAASTRTRASSERTFPGSLKACANTEVERRAAFGTTRTLST